MQPADIEHVGFAFLAGTAPAPLTATVESKPENHDGSSAFTVQIGFSERLRNQRLGEQVVRVTGGANTGSQRVGTNDDEIWEITIEPSGDVAIALAASDTCGTGIACTTEREPLSET